MALTSFVMLLVSIPGAASVLLSDNTTASTGTLGSWTVNYGYYVSDSFTLAGSANATGVTLDLWVYPADTPVSLGWAIGTSVYGNDVASGSDSSLSNIAYCPACAEGYYDLYTSSFSLGNIPLVPSVTYWLTIDNGVTSQGDPMFWDISNGPSVAFDSYYGNLAGNLFAGTNSNSFQITGDLATPEPGSITLLGYGLLLLIGGLSRKSQNTI